MPSTVQSSESESFTFVEFSLSDRTHPFVAASTSGGRAVMEELVPRSEAEYAEYFSVVGVEPEAVVAMMEDREGVDVRLLVRSGKSGLFEFLVDGRCPVVFLCLAGAVPRHVESTNGRGRITAEVPSSADPPSVVRRFRSVYPDAELTRKRQQPDRMPRFAPHEFPPTSDDLLTVRQRNVLAAASERGFYDWPRGTTGEELAGSIGISPSTLHQHLRAAEGHLVEWYLGNRAPAESEEADRRALLSR